MESTKLLKTFGCRVNSVLVLSSLQALFGLQNLHVLGLSDNELTVLPSAVSNLVNLREVDISKNGKSLLFRTPTMKALQTVLL